VRPPHPCSRGNLVYKSDVGRCWYDAQRPDPSTTTVTEHKRYLHIARASTGISATCTQTLVANPIIACPAGYSAQGNNCLNNATNGASLQASTIRYFHTDHIGSVSVITDETGAVVERMAYDPWGKRRFTNGTADTNDTIVGLTTDRGYTEHEELDELGIIHMNGRIYDPTIGRFMSADPFIQAPYELQSHNRYAYVFNNPLLFTDPSGYSAWTKFRDKVLKPIAVIAVVYFSGGAAAGYLGFAQGTLGYAITAGAVGGAVGAALNGGNLEQVLKGAVIGGLSGALFYGAGNIGESYGKYGAAHYAAHAIAGCVSSVAGGGQCGSGAASSLVGLGVTDATSGRSWNTITRGIAVSVAGGVSSMITGGSFESGVRTAAYGYLFNSLAHPTNTIEAGIRQAMLRGDIAELELLLNTQGAQLSAADLALAQKTLTTLQGGGAAFFEGSTMSSRIAAQAEKDGVFHGFPAAIDKMAAETGKTSISLDSRGAFVSKLTLDGAINGAKGVFEYVKNQAGEIYHRFFQVTK
jgi:RHS repeat-associated protein